MGPGVRPPSMSTEPCSTNNLKSKDQNGRGQGSAVARTQLRAVIRRVIPENNPGASGGDDDGQREGEPPPSRPAVQVEKRERPLCTPAAVVSDTVQGPAQSKVQRCA